MTRVASVSNRVRNDAALALLLLQSVSMAVAISASSQVPASVVLEYDGLACQGEPIMKHYLKSLAIGECNSPGNRPSLGTGKCQQTTDGISSYVTTCHTGMTALRIPPAGYLCRMMYNMSPACSDSAAIKQVDCFTLAKTGKCWKRSVSGFSVMPHPSGAGAAAHSMKLSFDSGSLSSGKQYSGPVLSTTHGGPAAVTAYDGTASGSDGSGSCGDGSCRCSTLTVRNGECDGYGTKYVW